MTFRKKMGLLIIAMMLASFAAIPAFQHGNYRVSAYTINMDFSNTSQLNWWIINNPHPNSFQVSIKGGELVFYGHGSFTCTESATVFSPVLNVTGPTTIIMRVNATNGSWTNAWGVEDGSGNPIAWFRVSSGKFTLNLAGVSKTLGLGNATTFTTYKIVITKNETKVYLNDKLVDSVGQGFSSFKVGFKNAGFSGSGTIWVDYVTIKTPNIVHLHLIDALTGKGLTGVTVKANGTTLGTYGDNQSIVLNNGQYTLSFTKTGYWSVTKTISVSNNKNLTVQMYPDTVAYKFENLPSTFSTFENTIYTLTFTLVPVNNNATYNTYLQLTDLNPTSVTKNGVKITPSKNGYYLGDIAGPTQVSITFKAGSVGSHGFGITLKSTDAIASNTYTTTKTMFYHVKPLPFTVQMPAAWKVGQNELRISEASGQSYTIVAVLRTTNGSQVWSSSHTFGPYEAHTFSVTVPQGGSYILELDWNNTKTIYNVKINSIVTLLTKEVTVKKGGSGIITVHIKNPTGSVQYYQLSLSGGFLPKPVTKNIALTPNTAKDVNIAFAVPSKLTYDAYELNVKVTQGNIILLNSKVPVKVTGSSGISILFGGSGPHIPTWFWPALAGAIVLGIFVFLAGRRR